MAYVGWARVSTQEQDLSIQLEKLKNAGCIKVFQGKRSGKSKENEQEQQKLLDYVREGDTVVATKMDRLGRSLTQVLGFIEKLKDKNVELKILDQALDTNLDDPMNKAFVQLLGMFAELEHEFIVSRTQEGRKATGRLGGRPSKLTDKQRSEIVRRLRSGITVSQLAREYDVSRATIIGIKKTLDCSSK